MTNNRVCLVLVHACSCMDRSIHLMHRSGKFRHLPVVDNGEVVAMLDIAKCLYDAISRMERASEKGKAAIANVAAGDDKYSIVEALKEQMFRPCLSAIVGEDSTYVWLN